MYDNTHVCCLAKDARLWLLHLSPILRGILPDIYLAHYYLLVTSMWILASDRINASDMQQAEQMIEQFSEMFGDLYGKIIIRLGIVLYYIL